MNNRDWSGPGGTGGLPASGTRTSDAKNTGGLAASATLS